MFCVHKRKIVKQIPLVLGNHISKGTRRLQMERSYSPVVAVKNRAIISLVGTKVEEGDKYYLIRAPAHLLGFVFKKYMKL